jgi:hypothetical protein
MHRLAIALSGTCAVIIITAAWFFRQDPTEERLRALEQEVAALREQLRIRPGLSPSPPRESESGVAATSTDSVQLSQRTQQIADLSTSVRRLEQTIEQLERRVTRPVVLAELEKEIRRQTEFVQASAAELQRIADESNVVLDERWLKDFDVTTGPPLDKNPLFQEARMRFLQNRRILDAAVAKFVSEMFGRIDGPETHQKESP